MNSYRKIFKKGEVARRKFQISNQQFKKMRFLDDDPENITFQKQKQKFIRPLTQYHKFQSQAKKLSEKKQQKSHREYSPNRRRYESNTPQFGQYSQFSQFGRKNEDIINKYNSQIKSQNVSISLGRRLKQKIQQKLPKQKTIILPYMPTIRLKLDDNFSITSKQKAGKNLQIKYQKRFQAHRRILS